MDDDFPKPKVTTKIEGDDLKTVEKKYVQYELGDPAVREAFAALLPEAQTKRRWDQIWAMHVHAIDVLKKNGFDATAGGYFRFPFGQEIQHYTTEWFAAEIANESWLIIRRKGQEKTDFDYEDMRRSFYLGELTAEWNFRANHEKNTRRGRTVRNAASKGGIERAREAAAEKYVILERMKQLVENGKSARCAATIVARERGKKTAGILSVWNRAKKDL